MQIPITSAQNDNHSSQRKMIAIPTHEKHKYQVHRKKGIIENKSKNQCQSYQPQPKIFCKKKENLRS